MTYLTKEQLVSIIKDWAQSPDLTKSAAQLADRIFEAEGLARKKRFEITDKLMCNDYTD